jgi:hypothetical protein
MSHIAEPLARVKKCYRSLRDLYITWMILNVEAFFSVRAPLFSRPQWELREDFVFISLLRSRSGFASC